jgi:hypothetical protein
MTDQSKLDAALLQIHKHFNEGAENYLLNNDQESKELVANLAARGLVNCNATRMVAGNLRIRWTLTNRITPAGLQRLEQILKQ